MPKTEKGGESWPLVPLGPLDRRGRLQFATGFNSRRAAGLVPASAHVVLGGSDLQPLDFSEEGLSRIDAIAPAPAPRRA